MVSLEVDLPSDISLVADEIFADENCSDIYLLLVRMLQLTPSWLRVEH